MGINLLPHAMQILGDLGLEPALAKVAVETQEAAFFNRFGQLIYREPLGRGGGDPRAPVSIHPGGPQAARRGGDVWEMPYLPLDPAGTAWALSRAASP